MTDPLSRNRYGKRVYEGILPPWWDQYTVAYPDDVSEIYTYTAYDIDSDTDVIQAIITVTYSSPLKDRVTSVKKSYNAPGAY